MKKILVIENDAATLEIVSILLGNSGYMVIPSETALSLQQISNTNPSLVIIDYLLTGEFGSALCSELKANASTQHIPVILFSASHHLEEIASNSHADAFISKPFDLKEFLQMVGKFIT